MARRISGAVSEIVSTVVNVLTLPFRVAGRIVTGGRGRTGGRTRRKAA